MRAILVILYDLFLVPIFCKVVDLPFGVDFFQVKFQMLEDYENVIKGGPWFVRGKFLTIRRWTPNCRAFEASFSLVAENSVLSQLMKQPLMVQRDKVSMVFGCWSKEKKHGTKVSPVEVRNKNKEIFVKSMKEYRGREISTRRSKPLHEDLAVDMGLKTNEQSLSTDLKSILMNSKPKGSLLNPKRDNILQLSLKMPKEHKVGEMTDLKLDKQLTTPLSCEIDTLTLYSSSKPFVSVVMENQIPLFSQNYHIPSFLLTHNILILEQLETSMPRSQEPQRQPTLKDVYQPSDEKETCQENPILPKPVFSNFILGTFGLELGSL
ncbi:hypothetical protein REPUB_Repub01dG0174100 [Reevesia pubescens]